MSVLKKYPSILDELFDKWNLSKIDRDVLLEKYSNSPMILSYLFSICKYTRILFGKKYGDKWVKANNEAFNNKTPLFIMTHNENGIVEVLTYLIHQGFSGELM